MGFRATLGHRVKSGFVPAVPGSLVDAQSPRHPRHGERHKEFPVICTLKWAAETRDKFVTCRRQVASIDSGTRELYARQNQTPNPIAIVIGGRQIPSAKIPTAGSHLAEHLLQQPLNLCPGIPVVFPIKSRAELSFHVWHAKYRKKPQYVLG